MAKPDSQTTEPIVGKLGTIGAYALRGGVTHYVTDPPPGWLGGVHATVKREQTPFREMLKTWKRPAVNV